MLASLGLFLALLLLAAQAPLHYAIEIGKEEGYGSDRPIVADFHDPETSPSTGSNFRWTTERSLIRLPGVGQRPLQLRLRLLPVNQEVAARGPQAIEVWAGGVLLGRLPIRPTSGGTYHLLVPAPADGSGNQEIELRGVTFTPTGDSRAIGTPVDAALVESRGGPIWPAWGSTLLWLLAAVLLWLGLRRAGLSPNAALIGLLLGILAGQPGGADRPATIRVWGHTGADRTGAGLAADAAAERPAVRAAAGRRGSWCFRRRRCWRRSAPASTKTGAALAQWRLVWQPRCCWPAGYARRLARCTAASPHRSPQLRGAG